MDLKKSLQLYNGVDIPMLGLGTWEIDDETVTGVVEEAIKIGYRHIDTAQAYENEAGVGRGIKNSGIDRKDLFVTTKVDAEILNYHEAIVSIEESLEKLDLEYVDLLLIHSPQPWYHYRTDRDYSRENVKVWRALEEMYEAGKARAIGVSNFSETDLQKLTKKAKIKPMINQVLTHISNTPTQLIEFCQNNNIMVEAYSPIGHGKILDHPFIKEMAEKYEVTIPQLCIRYCLDLGLVTIPKSQTPAHMKSNIELDFEISPEDLEALKAVDRIESYGEFDKYSVFSNAFDLN